MNDLGRFVSPVLDVYLTHKQSDQGRIYKAIASLGVGDSLLTFWYFVTMIVVRYKFRNSKIEFPKNFFCETSEGRSGPYSLQNDRRYGFLATAIEKHICSWNDEDVSSITNRSSEMSAIDQVAESAIPINEQRIVLVESVLMCPPGRFLSDCVLA